MKKRSVVFGIMLGAMILFSAVNLGQQILALKDRYAQNLLTRERYLGGIIDFSKALGDVGQWDPLHSHLEKFRQDLFLDFYVLKYKGEIIWWASENGKSDRIARDFTIVDKPIRNDQEVYQTSSFKGDMMLTVGFIKNDPDLFVRQGLSQFKYFLIQEWLIFGFVVLLVALWNLRDLLLMAFRVRRGDMKAAYKTKTQSTESDLLARGLQGYAESTEVLAKVNQALDRQVLPSLKTELLSGRKPPYDFNCTLVRVDINNFTNIYNKCDVREFMSSINDFFVEVSHIVARYDGLIHEFVGDEVIFYCKDSPAIADRESAHRDSFLRALSATRDIGRVAEDFDRRLKAERGYGFTVKASLAHGSLHFGPLVNGFSVAGSVLIETVRILSVVTEKKQNSVYFDHRHRPYLGDLIEAHDALTQVQLKGFDGETTLLAYDRHRDLTEILKRLDGSTAPLEEKQTIQDLLYFRADHEVAIILQWLQSRPLAHDASADRRQDLAVAIVKGLSQFSLTRLNLELVTSIFDWLDRLVDAGHAPRLVSALVSLIPHLVPQSDFNALIEGRIVRIARYPESRVQANLVEVLSHFGSHASLHDHGASKMKADSSTDLRLQANLLVRQAEQRLDDEAVAQLKRMLEDASPLFKASAVFALGEIAAFYIARDRVYLKTRASFMELLAQVPRLIEIRDESVRRQVFRTVEKCEDPQMVELLREVIADLHDPSLQTEFNRRFDARPAGRSAS